MIQEAVPGDVKELLERRQLNGVPVLLSTTSDLSLAGHLRGHRIVVTRENLAVVAGDHEPELVNHLPIGAWKSFAPRAPSARASCRPTSTIGGSTWRAYSNTHAARFHLLATKLEDLRKSGTVTVHPEEERDKNHCPQCGLRLAAAGESCPRCLPKKAIAARLWQLMRPQWPTALGNVS